MYTSEYFIQCLESAKAIMNFFFMLMNLPSPITQSSYHKLTRKIHRAVNVVSNETMLQISQEIIGKSKNVTDITDIIAVKSSSVKSDEIFTF